MKKSFLFILAFTCMVSFGDTKISELPLQSAAATGATDSFPFVSVSAFQTRRVFLSDLINLPAMQAQFSLMIPNQSGNAGKCLKTNATITSWEPCSAGVTSISTGVGLTGGPITTTGTISLANTAVTPGSYVSADITVDAQGRITAASTNQVPSQTIKGRTTAGAGNAENLTATQATAILDVFNSGSKGLASASGGGTTNFLRADGTWTTPAAAVFGTQYSYNESLGSSTTTSATYQNKVTLTTATLPAGDYYVAWSSTISNSNNTGTTNCRSQVDGTTTLSELVTSAPAANSSMGCSGHGRVTLTNATHTLTIDYSRPTSGTAAIQDARVSLWRVN